MPPHCDTRDGPVVKAAKIALETKNPSYVLIWVPKDAEKELMEIFEKTLEARTDGKAAQGVADDWFFENTIRLHRAGEGAPYTGMKPAGLDEGPVVPIAEKAIGTGNPQETIDFILGIVEDDLNERFRHVMATKKYDIDDVDAGREFIEAFIGWVVYAHHLYAYVKSGGGHDTGPGKHGRCEHP